MFKKLVKWQQYIPIFLLVILFCEDKKKCYTKNVVNLLSEDKVL